jgi:tripartite-type tricarboxylate transporter receptor subunit TctC
MRSGTRAALALAAAFLCCSFTGALAQQYPSKPVRIIVPFPAAGAVDATTRILGDKLSAKWGQPVIVDNRPGAASNIGAAAAYRAEPDGYTLLACPTPTLAINQNLYKDLPFDPAKFVPITLYATLPNAIAARIDLPANSVKELIAYAKANPGKVTYASQGSGTTSHLAAEMLASMAGLELVHIPYKGEVPALTDMLAGRVDIFIGNIYAGLRFQQAGKVKFLGVADTVRSPVVPDIPTVSEAGLPGFVAIAWFALVAPPGTPNAIAQQINAAVVEALKLPDVEKRFRDQGLTPVGNSPAEMAAFVAEETARWGNVIRTAHITLQ